MRLGRYDVKNYNACHASTIQQYDILQILMENNYTVKINFR